jgi:hypothetical protein
MVFSSLTRVGHVCPLSNTYWRYDVRLDQDDENESRTSEGLGHGKTDKVLNGVAHGGS